MASQVEVEVLHPMDVKSSKAKAIPLPSIRRNIDDVQASSYECSTFCAVLQRVYRLAPSQSTVVQSHALHADWGWLCMAIFWGRKPTSVTAGD